MTYCTSYSLIFREIINLRKQIEILTESNTKYKLLNQELKSHNQTLETQNQKLLENQSKQTKGRHPQMCID